MHLKAIILVGGVQKAPLSSEIAIVSGVGEIFGDRLLISGTRFRPLSLQLPKPLFPIAGRPLIGHHIGQLIELKGELAADRLEILLLGFYPAEQFANFIEECRRECSINTPIKYLEESESLGTAGGLLQFRDEILSGEPDAVFVLNADVCGDLPLGEMVAELYKQPKADCLILTTEATREQSKNFGSVVIKAGAKADAAHPRGPVLHYVDKPTTFVSTHISCGIYLLRPKIWQQLERARGESDRSPRALWFESDVFPKMASNHTLYAIHTARWWSQTKTAAAALYANRHYLRLYREKCPERLCSTGAEIVGDVYIDPTAEIHPTAKIGPNVSIGMATSEEHCCVLHSIVGWRSVIGQWARVEGTPIAPNPNLPFAKLDNKPLFNSDGRLNPSLTILGSDVDVHKETVILNSVVLPYKDLVTSYKNQIIL